MKRLVVMLGLFAAGAVALAPLTAGDNSKKGKDIDTIFRRLDANMDGRLTRDEFLRIAEKFRDKDKARNHLGQSYDKLDPERKGLSVDQFRAFIATTAQKKGDEPKKADR